MSTRTLPANLYYRLSRFTTEMPRLASPVLQLSALAGASLIIYVLAFVRPYSLLTWWRIPQQTIGKISHGDLMAGGAYVLAFSALFLLYGLAYRLSKGHQSVSVWSTVIAGAVAFNAAMLLLYPVDAADVFDDIIRGRMTAYYGANPFYQAPIQFKQDRFYPYAAWDYYPSAYGPGWEGIAAGAARLAGNGVIANVLTFKMVGVLAYAGTLALIGLTLRRWSPQNALYGVTLFGWNPLVIYAVAGNGHNDAVMVLFMVLGFYFLAHRRFTLAALAETAGALVKFVPVLLVPVVLLVALKQLAGWRARARYLLLTVSACALLMVVAYAPFWRGGDVAGIHRRSQLYTTSPSTLLNLTLKPRLGGAQADLITSRAALILMGIWGMWQLRAVWRNDERQAPARAGLSILLFYLLVSCLWFQSWYVIWPLALAALIPDGPTSRGSLLFSLVATWKMPIFTFVLMISPTHLPPPIWREWRLTLDTLSVPWAYFVYQGIKANKRYLFEK
jgi:alpha-1,6-mannosyltransferase